MSWTLPERLTPAQREGLKEAGWTVAMALGVALFACASVVLPWGRDQGIYAHAAARTLDGYVPYSETFIFKPPGTVAVHAMSQLLFGATIQAIRWFDVLWTLAGALAVQRVARVATGSRGAAAFAGVIFAWQLHRVGYWNGAQTDGFANLPLGLALVGVLVGGGPRARAFGGMCAGLALSFAFWLKYPYVGLFAAVVVVPLIREGWAGWRTSATVCAGLVAGIGGVFGLLAILGGADDLLAIQREIVVPYTGASAENGLSRRVALDVYLGRVPGWFTETSLGLWGLGAALALGTPLVRWATSFAPEGSSPSRLSVAVLDDADLARLGALAWLAVGFLSGWMQGKAWEYQHLAMIGGGSVLAVLGPWRVVAWAPRLAPVAGLAGLIGLGVAASEDVYPNRWEQLRKLATGEKTYSQLWRAGDYSNGGTSLHDNRALATWLRRNTEPGATVFLWGYEPMVYVLADRTMVSRFPYTYPMIVPWAPPSYRQELLAVLEATPPDVFIVGSRDSVSVVTGVKKDSRTSLREWPELAAFVERTYPARTEVDRFEVYRRVAPGKRKKRTRSE